MNQEMAFSVAFLYLGVVVLGALAFIVIKQARLGIRRLWKLGKGCANGR